MQPLNVREVFSATEATFEPDSDDTWITIIKEGESKNGRTYQRNALKQAVLDRVYENQRMFVDHSDGPPLKRSLKELVSGIVETKYDDTNPDGVARVRGRVKWFNKDFKEFIEKAKDHTGVSHDARLAGFRTREHGRIHEDISEIKKVNSVDWVVYPSAGGGIEQFYATEGIEPMTAVDWDSLTPEMIEENAPELYKQFKDKFSVKESEEEDEEEDEEEETPASGAKVLDEKAVEAIVARAFESQQKKQSLSETVKKQISAEVAKTTLPDRTKNRIVAQFDGAEEFDADRVKEAIEDAKAELKEAGAGPKVTGMGPSKQSSGSGSLGRVHEAVGAAFSIQKSSAKNADKDPDEEANK